jgi:Nucleotidyl transferase AbiEii toxin, Type IV TA system
LFLSGTKTFVIQMLQSQTVTRATLELLKTLMTIPALKEFALVGGTNLSLRFGHRLSIDLDLFTNKTFEAEAIFNALNA